MIRILNGEPNGYSRAAKAILDDLGRVDEVDCDRAALLARIESYDVLIVRLRNQIDRQVLAAASRLKVLVTATTGLDHVDLDEARRRGIEVLSLRGETEFLKHVSATAELTWGLLLAVMRGIPAANASIARGEWDRDAFRGDELDGKRLGIIGLGRIGTKIARYGLAFGMRVAAFDPYVTAWVPQVDRADCLLELLSACDVASLHVHLSPETQHMMGRDQFAAMPRGGCFVNTSRGEMVDESALAEALESGHLAGAALDVMEHERDPQHRLQSPLLAAHRAGRNLIITPHLGGATRQSMERTEIFMAQKLARFLQARGATIAG